LRYINSIMKFFVALLSIASAMAAKPMHRNKMHQLQDIKADSKMGQSLLSKARKLEENENDMTWVAGYSIKFQGCHEVSQWNSNDDKNEQSVRIVNKGLIRFRLCPAESCSATNAAGCGSGYGDYIIDMNTYLDSYFEAVENYNEWKCQYLEEMQCNCGDDDGKGDDFDEEKCLYDCYAAEGLETVCADKNPYAEEGEEKVEAFELREYMECGRWEMKNDRRKLADEGNVEYFMGPYCSKQGGAIYLGLFTDEDCTLPADDYYGKVTYETLAGAAMPYSSESVVGMDCVACKEPADFNENGDDAEDEDEVIEMCEQIYQQSGKCESNMGIMNPNTNACTYMEGIKIMRKDGAVEMKAGSANKAASVFIGLFVVAFVLLAAYVYYLRTKLDRASINLSE